MTSRKLDDRREASAASTPLLPRTVAGARVGALLAGVRRWAAERPDLVAIALVGSWARGAARPDSDVDLVLIVNDVAGYLAFPGWLGAFGQPGETVHERYGQLTALRVWYADAPEVEWGIADPRWLATDPVDPGTAAALRDGCVVLHDPARRLATLRAAVANDEGRP